MKLQNPKVISARSHVGVQIGAAVFNSLIAGKNGIESMELRPTGLHIVTAPSVKSNYVVPLANLQSVEIEKNG